MLKMHEIREIIKLVAQSNLQEFEVKGEDTRISIKKRAEPAAVVDTRPAVISQSISMIPSIPKVDPLPVPQPKPVNKKENRESAALPDGSLHKIVSPMVGTFYLAPGEDAPPFVKVGDKVDKSTVVCIVEAMKLFNEIEAEVKGEIVEVLLKNGQLVEHGQPLFLVRPE